MATPYPSHAFPPPQPTQQLYPEGGYQPAPGQFPSQPGGAFPPQGKPPAYVDYGGPPGHQPLLAPPPVTATSTTVVVGSQPTSVTAAYQPPPEEDHSGIATCALVFSIITLLCCGTFLLCLTCSIPALILAIVSLGARGSAQKSNAGISIALNVVVVVCSVLFLVIVIPTSVLRANVCSAYYSSSYSTYCVPYSYSSTYCSYYHNSYRGYCPT